MRKPIYVRPLTEDERQPLQAGLRSSNAFVLRRCQILLASARGQTARLIAEVLGCDDQTVRNAIQAFNTQGHAALTPRSSAPQRTPHAAFDAVRAVVRFVAPAPTHLWHTHQLVDLAAGSRGGVCRGITPRQVRGETILRALARLGVRWKRAKHWITSPDLAYARKNRVID
jgi:hypothetical protein